LQDHYYMTLRTVLYTSLLFIDTFIQVNKMIQSIPVIAGNITVEKRLMHQVV